MTSLGHWGSIITSSAGSRRLRVALLVGACFACSTERQHSQSVADAGTGGAAGGSGAGASGGSGGTAGAAGGTGGSGGTAGSGGDTGTGGSSGNAGQAGAGGATGSNRVRGAPCVVSPDGTNAEVLARGSDQRIYRRVVGDADAGSWAPLADLDGTAIDNRSDLACSSSDTTVHLVVLSTQPAGALVHATGLGTTYNPFARELDSMTFRPSPSVAARTSDYLLAGVNSAGYLQAVLTDGATATDLVPTHPLNLPLSSASVAALGTRSSVHQLLAIVDSTAQVALYEWVSQSGGASWKEPVVFAPPPQQQYEHAPGICTWYAGSLTSETRVHLVMVAGERLWHSVRQPNTSEPFSPWERVADVAVSSTPNCVVTEDGVLHIVALDAAGAVTHFSDSSGNFSVTDLGAY